MKKRVIIQAVSLDELPEMQKKINQWLTTGLLLKYQMHVVGDKIVFNICLKKEG